MPIFFKIPFNLISPSRLALGSVIIYFLFTCIPPSFYQFYIHEPDLMFFNPLAASAFVGFVTVFLLGYGVGLKITFGYPNDNTFAEDECCYSAVGVVLLALVLLSETYLLVVSLSILNKEVPDLYINFITDNAQRTKEELIRGSNDALGQIVPVSMGTIWWLIGRWKVISPNLSGLRRYCLYLSILSLITMTILYSSVLVSRFALFPLFLGSLIVYYVNKLRRGSDIRNLNLYLLITPIFLVAMFIAFSSFRGIQGTDEILRTLVGYGPASYNRFAAIMVGKLNLYTPYLRLNDFGFVFKLPFLSRFFDVNSFFGLPDQDQNQISLILIGNSGLDGEFNWCGTFGQIYSDIGFFSLIYIFFYGVLAALLWKSTLKAQIAGQIIYPWMAVSIIWWFGYNAFFQQNFSVLCILAFLISVYERFFLVYRLDKGVPYGLMKSVS